VPKQGKSGKREEGGKRRRRDKERKVADCSPLLLVRGR
jgi:hypothetical protein